MEKSNSGAHCFRYRVFALYFILLVPLVAVASTVTFDKLKVSSGTATTVPYLDSNKLVTSSSVTPTELGYVHSVTAQLCGISQACSLTNKTIDGNSNTITNIGLTTEVTGTLPVANGGSGIATRTAHSLQVGNGTSPVTQIAVPATGTVLAGVAASDPAFSATPVLGVATTTAGTLGLSGVTSGVVTVKSQDTAGTYNFVLPNSMGSTGNYMTTNGTVASWTTPPFYSTAASTVRTEYLWMTGAAAANCTSTPCTATQTSGGFGTLTRNSAGNYTVNFSPAFTSNVVCTASCDINGTLAGSLCGVEGANTNSVIVVNYANNSTPTDGRVNLICVGQK